MRRALRLVVAPAVVMTAGACFATRSDVRVLQGDIAVLRAEGARADSLHREQLRQVARQIGTVSDSVRGVYAVLSKLQGDLSVSLHDIAQQIITVQELAGQSQKRLQEMRADLEARSRDVAPPPVTVAAAPGGAAPAPGPTAPGPLQLLQLAQAQLLRGSAGAARAGFEELLVQYPASDVAADAQYGIAESYASEANGPAADSAYALVVAKYPKSDRAPTALYKRATAFRLGKQVAQARALYQQVVDRYPRSGEAELAKEYLRTLK
jgi:tol-pal system protein YbgF